MTEAVAEDVTQEVVEQSTATTMQAPRRSGRIRHQPERYGLLVTKDDDVLLIEDDEPATYAEAVTGPNYREMACSHEIRDGVHIYQLGMDLG